MARHAQRLLPGAIALSPWIAALSRVGYRIRVIGFVAGSDMVGSTCDGTVIR